MAEKRREETYTPQQGRMQRTHIGASTTGDDVADAEHTSRVSSTAGAGLGAKGKGGAGMPKMSDYPNDLKGYSDAMRKYRESQATDPQKAAIRELAGGGAKR